MKISKKHALTAQAIGAVLIAITFLMVIVLGTIEVIEMWSTEDILWNIICSIGYPVVAVVMIIGVYKWIKHIINQWRIFKELSL